VVLDGEGPPRPALALVLDRRGAGAASAAELESDIFSGRVRSVLLNGTLFGAVRPARGREEARGGGDTVDLGTVSAWLLAPEVVEGGAASFPLGEPWDGGNGGGGGGFRAGASADEDGFVSCYAMAF
jgi:hypothetical protein